MSKWPRRIAAKASGRGGGATDEIHLAASARALAAELAEFVAEAESAAKALRDRARKMERIRMAPRRRAMLRH